MASRLSLPARTLRLWFADVIFRRAFRNAGLLLSGKVMTGLLGLAYLGITARALGVEAFGVLVLVQTYVQVLSGVTTFKSWHAVIRYGALCLEQERPADFHQLIRFTTLLDIAGVLIGAGLGYVAVPWVGDWLNWSPEVMDHARWYCFLVLFTVVATPTGLLRLYDRFDLLSWQVMITPALRLVGVSIAWLVDAPFEAFLLAWFVAGAIGGGALIVLGWREAARRGALTAKATPLADLSKTHPGIWRFAIAANFHSSLALVPGHMTTLIVGAVADAASVGYFKVAREVATALSKPAELLTQSIYPEFARLVSKGQWRDLGVMILRAGAVAGGAAGTVLLVVALFGNALLGAVFGTDFVEAGLTLVLLVAASALTVTGFAMDPAMYAIGRAGVPLKVNVAAILGIYLPGLVLLTKHYGHLGAGIAALASAATIFVVMAVLTFVLILRRSAAGPEHGKKPGDDATGLP